MGDNKIILQKVYEAQKKLIPINDNIPVPNMLPFTSQYIAETDSKLSNDYIGRICNLAQNLQSYYWHISNTGTQEQKDKYLYLIYNDICILGVLSNIAIDSAKRRYDVNIEKEIRRIKDRKYLHEKGAIINEDSIAFTLKGGERNKTYYKIPKFMEKNHKKQLKKIPKNATEKEIEDIEKYNKTQEELWREMYLPFDTPMDMIKEMIHSKIARQKKNTKTIRIIDILNDIPSGEKADYNRIATIIESAITYGKEIDILQERYMNNEINAEKLCEGKISIEMRAVFDYQKIKINCNDIIILIKKAYEFTDRYDTNGKLIEKNVDKRDKALTESKMGSRMLQWIFKAHKDAFLKAIKSSNGTSSSVKKLPQDYVKTDKEEIYELYGTKYVIDKTA